ncbi:hypothetical protein ROA7023_02382 [Roseisalinus antarcticus]|uniref:Uncharacterized protein n=1 Tax=Roseisalinus antarcticus TaxID=254357 RepID=A0A1Y5T6G3_9RHOB|nr:hypothetical protein ROA7023_02382 [Roseisalinus antarcticus]
MRCLKSFGDRFMAFAIVARTNGAKWLTPD